MSELIDNAAKRKGLLKEMILHLHEGTAPEEVRERLVALLGKVPYDEVVEVEQELIRGGLPTEEVQKLCDVHTEALRGVLSHEGAKEAPPGHPVDTFLRENRALLWEIEQLENLFARIDAIRDDEAAAEIAASVRARIHALADVEKHYLRKENLLFPFLEKHGITGPSKVMWGKHDETRALLGKARETADRLPAAGVAALRNAVASIRPLLEAITAMILKEEQILLPMSLDKLSEVEWYAVALQSVEIGFCLYDPTIEWKPEGVIEIPEGERSEAERIQLPSGSFTALELEAILNSIPFDLTFVDANDTVRYFTQGRERVFARNRAILGRKVQNCHPPASLHVVQRIVDDFRSGKEDHAPFWIDLHGRFIHIEYFALRDRDGAYLGTLEVSQDLTAKRALEGEQRLLSWGKEEGVDGRSA